MIQRTVTINIVGLVPITLDIEMSFTELDLQKFVLKTLLEMYKGVAIEFSTPITYFTSLTYPIQILN